METPKRLAARRDHSTSALAASGSFSIQKKATRSTKGRIGYFSAGVPPRSGDTPARRMAASKAWPDSIAQRQVLGHAAR